MLSKLIKYEFKATARIFLLAYVVVIVLAGIDAAISPLRPDGAAGLGLVFSALLGLLFWIAAAAVILLTFVIIVMRFYRMLGDEGYLWFTLPVTPAQQILGKLIPAIVWTIASVVVVIASASLALVRLDWIAQLSDVWRGLAAQGFHPGVWLVCGLVFILISLLVNVMMFYTAMSVGPNLLKANRLGGSVLAYLIVYFALEAINLVGFGVIVVLFGKTLSAPNHGTTVTSIDAATGNQAGLIFGSYFGVEYLVLAVAGFLITRYFISRKLNLS